MWPTICMLLNAPESQKSKASTGGLSTLHLLLYFFFLFLFYNCTAPMGFLPWRIRVDFLGESILRQNRSIQPTVHAGCLSVSIIHRTLAWITGSLTCAQMLMHAIAHGGCSDTVTESALKADSGPRTACRSDA